MADVSRIPDDGVTIGALAAMSGVHVETIRYYQRQGLLPVPARVRGSVRRYGQADLDRLRFIRRAQALGFSLAEIALLLELSEGEHCTETQQLAEKKLALVREKLTDLRSIESALTGLVSACRAGKRGAGCPIIESLAANDETTTRRASPDVIPGQC